MKVSGTYWRLTALVLVLLTLGIGFPASAAGPTFPIDAVQIPFQEDARPVADFIGHTAVAKPITAAPIPINPFMLVSTNGKQSWAAIHNDTYMSDVYVTPGPLGRNPEVFSAFLRAMSVDGKAAVGIGGGTVFDSHGLMIVSVIYVTVDRTETWGRLTLFDPDTLQQLAGLDLKPTPFSGGRPAGLYLYQDNQDRTVIGTPERTVRLVSHTPTAFHLDQEYDLSGVIPADDKMQALQPDGSGLVWFTSEGGAEGAVVGTLDMDTGAIKWMKLPGERIVNGHAADADENGGVYIATTRYMYRFDRGVQGQPAISWRESYDAGSHVKAGQVDIGTGTTPTLMGNDYVTITDNAEPRMHVVVWKRAKQLAPGAQRLVCEEPVFLPGQSSNENSLVATDKSIVVENNFGYKGSESTMHGSTTKPGIARIDINPDGNGCHTEWTNMAESIPTVVTKLSLANGLIYTYTKPKGPANTDPWYFTAIDFATGQTVYKKLAGTGLFYDNSYSAVTLGPNGTAYVGVLGGIVAMRDR
jgi:hypothetical protein